MRWRPVAVSKKARSRKDNVGRGPVRRKDFNSVIRYVCISLLPATYVFTLLWWVQLDILTKNTYMEKVL